MITLGVGTGEEAAPIQVGRLFDMIALRVDAVGGGGGAAYPRGALVWHDSLGGGAEGGAYWREERMFTTKALRVGTYSGEGAY